MNAPPKSATVVVFSLLSAIAAAGVTKATIHAAPVSAVTARPTQLRFLPKGRLGVLVQVSEGRREEVREIVCGESLQLDGRPFPQAEKLCVAASAFAKIAGEQLGVLAVELGK